MDEVADDIEDEEHAVNTDGESIIDK